MAQIEKISGSSGSALNERRSGTARIASENISTTGKNSHHTAQRRYGQKRRILSHRNASGASAPFLAQYLGEPGFMPDHPLDARREMTLAYIGADMLPELLAETRRPRCIDRKF